MKNKFIFLPLLVLTGGAITATAQTVTAAVDDLILGFANSSGTGASTNLEIDLGSVSNFYSVSGTEQLSGLVAADLVSTYGANWNTLATLTWGVAGSTGGSAQTLPNTLSIPKDTLWGTKAESTLGVQSTPWTTGVFPVSQQTSANKIVTLYTGAQGSLNGATATTNSATAALINAASAGSWNNEIGTSASAFAFFNPTNLFTNGVNGGFGEVSDLYQVEPGSGTAGPSVYLGSFALGTSGELFYSGTALGAASVVPEPSTYAALAGLVALGFVALRRRNRSQG